MKHRDAKRKKRDAERAAAERRRVEAGDGPKVPWKLLAKIGTAQFRATLSPDGLARSARLNDKLRAGLR